MSKRMAQGMGFVCMLALVLIVAWPSLVGADSGKIVRPTDEVKVGLPLKELSTGVRPFPDPRVNSTPNNAIDFRVYYRDGRDERIVPGPYGTVRVLLNTPLEAGWYRWRIFPGEGGILVLWTQGYTDVRLDIWEYNGGNYIPYLGGDDNSVGDTQNALVAFMITPSESERTLFIGVRFSPPQLWGGIEATRLRAVFGWSQETASFNQPASQIVPLGEVLKTVPKEKQVELEKQVRDTMKASD